MASSDFSLRPGGAPARFSPARGFAPALLFLTCGTAHALDRTWIGGDADWLDNGLTTHWSPNDEPDADDRAIFNTTNNVSLGSDNSVNGLALSGEIQLLTDDFDLTVDGLTELSGTITHLNIGGAASLLNTDDLTINTGATVELAGGSLTLDEESGTSVLDMNVGGSFVGNGTVTFADVPGGVTTQWINDGTLTALSRTLVLLGAPPVGTLAINAAGANARIDLDGAGEAGVVNVNRNQTLDLNIALADNFNGDLNLFHETTFSSAAGWAMAGGTIDVNNGFIDGSFPIPDVPAGVAIIEGGSLAVSGGTITVMDTDGTLRFDNSLSMSGGTLSNSGKTIFNGVTSITSATALVPASLGSSIEVSSSLTINDAAGNFNWDGPGTASTTVLGSGILSITANLIDTADNLYGGTLNLNDNADLTVNVTANEWTIASTLNKNNAGTSVVSGDRMVVTGTVNANAGTLDLPEVATSPTATITASGTLLFGGASEFAGATSISGSGLLRMEGTSTVSANTAINVATFDWDGLGIGTNHTIANGVSFTINSPALDGDGDMDDPVTLAGGGTQLIVNGPTQWTATNTFNANTAAAGTATIGGTSRVIFTSTLNVDGNTNVSAPVTFGAGSFLGNIDAAMTLNVTSADCTYAGGTIDGAGIFDPGISNTLTGDFAINSDLVNFDGGTWTIESGTELTLNVLDYEPGAVTNSFENTITMNGGTVSMTTGDAEFVMNGTLNMNAGGGASAEWFGEPLDIGNDDGTLDANLNVTGDGNPNFQGRLFSQVDFNSDADVDVPAGASLSLNGTVNFHTVNAANNAEFTGAGTILFSMGVNVVEAATLNLVGGTVDLDGVDDIGETVNVDAPFTINAATLTSFGRVNGGGGINTLDINNNAGTGVFAVNLDSAVSEWTLNGPGVMNLVNDNTAATLLAGNAVNLNGTVNVTGDVRVTARLDIAGVVDISTAAEPLRLAGGDNATSPNTLAGGTISGVGLLGADDGRALTGFGTISTGVDFDGNADLLADNGTLNVNGSILDARNVGTADVDGILNVVNAWNSSVVSTVSMQGGTLQGGTITLNNADGIAGRGTVASRVLNNTRLNANSPGNSLILQTAGNNHDWDGGGTGQLMAQGGILELRDVGPAEGFTGTVTANTGGRVFANGFALDFNPGSSIQLDNGTYESNSSTDIGGSVTVNGASPSTIKVENNFFLSFEAGSTTTLNQNLALLNNNIIIEAGATFSGIGALTIPDGSHLVMDHGANANVLLDLQGDFRPGNAGGIGQATVKDYQQAASGQLIMDITGTALNQYDRVAVNGIAVVGGHLALDMDLGFVPSVGQTFNILSASGGVTGNFDSLEAVDMPMGLTFKINYLPTIVQVEVISGSHYESWIHLFPSLTNPSDRLRTADPDHDGLNNLVEFALDGNPVSGAPTGKVVTKIAPVGGVNALTLTFPVRYGLNTYDQAGGEFLMLGLTTPYLYYRVQASDDLVTFGLTVDQVLGADATAIQSGLPPLSPGWDYTTFRSPGPVADDPAEFMRLDITENASLPPL